MRNYKIMNLISSCFPQSFYLLTLMLLSGVNISWAGDIFILGSFTSDSFFSIKFK
jgi:hypothetical protein